MKEVVFSPVGGKVIHLEHVNDEVFSNKMLGDGIAVLPEDKVILSPVNGKVTMFFKTKHAIGILTSAGTEILIHVGIDTVNLNGKYFEDLVNVDDEVHVGDALLKADFDGICSAGFDPVTIVICLNKPIKEISNEVDVIAGSMLFATI